MSAYAKLRRKRQLFVDAYVRLGVGRDAAEAAGYPKKSAHVRASELKANLEVAAAIAERQQEAIERAGMRHVVVLEEIAGLYMADIGMLFDENGKRRPLKEVPKLLLRAAESITFNDDGSIKSVKMARTAGLNMAGKYLKILADVVEHQGKDGGPIKTEEVSDLEKARSVAYLLAQGLRAARAAVAANTNSDDESDVSTSTYIKQET